MIDVAGHVPFRERKVDLIFGRIGQSIETDIAAEVLFALLIWNQIAGIGHTFSVLPQPAEVIPALRRLWMDGGLGHELMVSFKMNLEALAWVPKVIVVDKQLAYCFFSVAFDFFHCSRKTITFAGS